MNLSSHLVFSIIKNTQKMIKTSKDLDVFKLVFIDWYSKSPEFIIQICKKLYNDLENGYYEPKDIAIFILYDSIFNDVFKYSSLTKENILKVKNIFTKKQLEKDKQFILDVNKKLKLNDPLKELFEIKEDGNSIIYELIMKEYITIIFYIYFQKKVLTEIPKDVIFSTEYNKFQFVNNKIINLIKGDRNE